MNKIAEFVKTNRKKAGLTQEEFAFRSGLNLKVVRAIEQGKTNVLLSNVNKALDMFSSEAGPVRKEYIDE